MGKGSGPGGRRFLSQQKVPSFRSRKEMASKASPLSRESISLVLCLLFSLLLLRPGSPRRLARLLWRCSQAALWREANPGALPQWSKSIWSHQSHLGQATHQGGRAVAWNRVGHLHSYVSIILTSGPCSSSLVRLFSASSWRGQLTAWLSSGGTRGRQPLAVEVSPIRTFSSASARLRLGSYSCSPLPR